MYRIYQELIEEFGVKICEKLNIGSQDFYIVKKWSWDSQLYPFSDIDFRIVVVNKNINIKKLNSVIASITLEFSNRSEVNNRIFEHSVGYIYFSSELELLSKSCVDILTWEFCYGNLEQFNRDIKLKTNIEDKEIENYFLNLFQKRFKRFSLKNEFHFQDKVLNIQYRKYCIIYHYYLLCLLSIYNIISKDKINSKIIAFEKLSDLYNVIKLKDLIYDESMSEEELLNLIENDLDKVVSNNDAILKNTHKVPFSEDAALNGFFISIRARYARCLYYTNKYNYFDCKYLLEREVEEYVGLFNKIAKYEDSKFCNDIINIINDKNIDTYNCINKIKKAFEENILELESVFFQEISPIR